jgi:hypothetical protein
MHVNLERYKTVGINKNVKLFVSTTAAKIGNYSAMPRHRQLGTAPATKLSHTPRWSKAPPR